MSYSLYQIYEQAWTCKNTLSNTEYHALTFLLNARQRNAGWCDISSVFFCLQFTPTRRKPEMTTLDSCNTSLSHKYRYCVASFNHDNNFFKFYFGTLTFPVPLIVQCQTHQSMVEAEGAYVIGRNVAVGQRLRYLSNDPTFIYREKNTLFNQASVLYLLCNSLYI